MASSAGVRALGAGLKELRIHLCQKSAASQGARDFVENFYVPMKQQNPDLPILVRECSGINPKLYARFAFGKEDTVDVSNMGKGQVLEALYSLTGSSAHK